MTEGMATGFFAYPSFPPHIAETVHAAIKEIQQSAPISIKPWDDCRVGGKVIIQEICKEIDLANVFCADLTGMNANVMFELGYAIARNKRIWLALDTTLAEEKKKFDQMRILTGIGYASYCNSLDVKSMFLHDSPYLDLTETVFERAIKPNLSPARGENLLYLKSRHETEASIRLTKRIQRSPLAVIVDDPRESGVQSITWYGCQLFSSSCLITHLTSPDREGARLHNARYALVSGMASGLEVPLVILAEGDFLAPIDYRELVKHYRTAVEAVRRLDEWLAPIEAAWKETSRSRGAYAATLELATELKGLQLGEYIAENESDRLVQDYFIETASYREALDGSHTVFVGRKGSGKTANLFKLASVLRQDRRNLVCVIKPVAYELHGVVQLLRRYKERDVKGYAVESLWKFLLYTEIARQAVNSIEGRPDQAIRDNESSLFELSEEKNLAIREDFSIRLERCVEKLLSSNNSGEDPESIERSRVAVSEALHSQVLGRLRVALGEALKNLDRVAILVDNLDKAWDRKSDLDELADFLLGLLGAARRLQVDFRRSDSRRKSVNVSLAIFLRSDIFHKLMNEAREPDKIGYSKLIWNDPQLLMRVVEERFVASHAGNLHAREMWIRYFPEIVRGIETKDYILSRILPRPRDLMFFVKAAVGTAVNRGRARVEQDDILEAEKQYSQYALDSVLVENGVTIPTLESILYEFVGCEPILSDSKVQHMIFGAGVEAALMDEVIDHLCSLTFLGIEVNDGDFRYADDPSEHRKNLVHARKLAETRGGRLRFKINPAFRAFLEVRES